MCHELRNSVQKYLPFEDIKNYLVQILEKTEKEKHILDSECRKTQDILHFYCTRKKLLEINENTLECAENFTKTPEKPSESEKEIVLKADAAIKHAKNVMKEVEKEMKNPKKFVKTGGMFGISKDRKLCNKKESFDNSREQDNRKPPCNKSEKIKKQGSDLVKDNVKQISSEVKRKFGNAAKGGGEFITTYKKDFASKNKQVKNFGLKCTVQAPLMPKDNRNNVESIHFNGIDDLLERVTPHPSVPSLCDNNFGSIRFVRNSSTATVLNNSLLSERTPSKWECSGDPMKVFAHYCELISLIKNNRRRQACSSNFLLKLKDRNNNLISSTEKTFEKYKSSMKMMSKCSASQRNYNYSSISNFEGTFRVIFCDNPKLLQLELKMCASDEKYLQLELLNLLKKNLNMPLQKKICSSHFYKTCDNLVNISPV